MNALPQPPDFVMFTGDRTHTIRGVGHESMDGTLEVLA